jgi:hypothetical protein
MDEIISEKKLYRATGLLYVRIYRRAKRMDIRWTPYWRVGWDFIARKKPEFRSAELLYHDEKNEK